jgi:hypothetical protein
VEGEKLANLVGDSSDSSDEEGSALLNNRTMSSKDGNGEQNQGSNYRLSQGNGGLKARISAKLTRCSIERHSQILADRWPRTFFKPRETVKVN